MEINELQEVFDRVLANTVKTVGSGRRELIVNERFFHHQFSHYAAKHYERKRRNPWRSNIIQPEPPTEVKYKFSEFGLNRPKTTLKLAIGSGTPSNHDFIIDDDPRIYVEWRGPRMYLARDVAIDLTKLMMLAKHRPVKVFAAILVNTGGDEIGYAGEMQTRFYEGMNFVQKIFEIPDMSRTNLYAYIAAVSEHGARKFIWGRV